ncbi:unnamed protein product [Notodromas monacha]|nr:unnamed protein product [Notodromas monacha]CAG0925527.1 unnamed protein product [Notodromas monacha]
MVDEYINWNEDIGEWQLKCVAYTGNNMRKLSVGDSPEKNRSKNAGVRAAAGETNLTHMYISYAEDGLRVPFNPDRKQRQDRPKTAAGKRLLN